MLKQNYISSYIIRNIVKAETDLLLLQKQTENNRRITETIFVILLECLSYFSISLRDVTPMGVVMRTM